MPKRTTLPPKQELPRPPYVTIPQVELTKRHYVTAVLAYINPLISPLLHSPDYALVWAIDQQNPVLFQWADQQGANKEIAHCLKIAVGSGFAQAIRTLVAQGGQVAKKNDLKHYELLEDAISQEHHHVILLLIELGCNINDTDCNGKTIISRITSGQDISNAYLTTRTVSPEMLATLVKCGASLNLKDNRKHTLLHNAVTSEDTAMYIKELVNLGVPIDEVNASGNTALHLTVLSHFDPTGGEEGSNYSDHSNIIRLLVSLGANINARNNEGQTPLHIAAARDHASAAVDCLIELNADATIEDHHQKTALHYMAENPCSFQSFCTLLKVTSNLNLRDKNGRTPLLAALAHAPISRNTNFIREMIEEDRVDLTIVDNNGENALTLALKNNYPQEIKDLLKFYGVTTQPPTRLQHTSDFESIANNNTSLGNSLCVPQYLAETQNMGANSQDRRVHERLVKSNSL